MAILSKTERIDEHVFEVTQLTAKRAVRLVLRLGKMAGPSLMGIIQAALQGSGAASLKGGSSVKGALAALEGLDVSKLGPALEGFFDRVSDADMDYLQKELLETAIMDGAPLWPQYDVALQGQLGTVFKLLWFALRVQFENFSRDRVASPRAVETEPESLFGT